MAESDNATVHHVRQQRSGPSFARLLTVSIVVRLVFDTGVQIFNPFLPIFARGMGITEVALGWLVGLRNVVGLIGPLFGTLGDKKSYQLVMVIGLTAGGAGSILVGISSSWLVAIIGMLIWGIGTAAFTPALHAYLSSRLPYAQRARGIGILEYSWALAGIVGLYTMGYLISWWGWRAPFMVLGLLMLVSMVVIALWLPSEASNLRFSETSDTSSAPPQPPLASTSRWARFASLLAFFDLGSNGLSAYANIAGSSLLFFGAVQLMITHGLWLQTEYAINAVQLGTVALLMGCSDLCGSISVSLFTDKLGKRYGVMLGAVGALLGYLALPFLNINIYTAVAGLAFARGSFEFGIVSNISLISEQIPQQRGKVLTLAGAANLLAGAAAGVSGPWMYQESGILGLVTLSAAATVLCLVTFYVAVRDR